MKQVYFACSIRSGRDDANIYGELVEYIAERSTVLSEIFADKTLTVQGSPGKTTDIYANDIAWVREADVLIAEVTNPSLGVGYEIAKAEEWGKPVLALFRDTGERKLSAMIDGSPHLKVVYYKKISDAKKAIDDFLLQ
jgi:nucleoside 2-deoxyribosyltransferase